MTKITRLFLFLLLCSATFVQAQITLPPSGDNQKTIVTQYIGALAHVTITYNSPNVTAPNGQSRRGGIWGQVVPYGLAPNNFGTAAEIPWRAGSNENTVFEFSHDVLVQGQALKAGRYGFHVIPQENGPWTLIFSRNADSWGSYFYDPAEDALRVSATPEPCAYHEWLTYEFTDRQPASARVALMWEELSLPFTIEVPNMNDLYVEAMRRELRSSPGFNWQSWANAAAWCAQNGVNLEEALTWADASISAPFVGEENFTTLSTKSQVLARLGRTAEAQVAMEKAVFHPTANAVQIHGYGRQLLAAGQKEKAMEVFKHNYEQQKGAWPTHVGMARGYSAMGDYKKALEHAQKALEQAPDQLNKDNLAQAIEKLKKKEDIN